MALGKVQESLPVQTVGVAAAMLTESQIPMDDLGPDPGIIALRQADPAEQPVDRRRGSRGKEASLGVDPRILLEIAGADEQGSRGRERNQLMLVDRQIDPAERAGIFEEIAGHPMIFAAAGEVLDAFAEIPPMEFRAPSPDEPMNPIATRGS